MRKFLDACVIIRLVNIGLFERSIEAYEGELYVARSAFEEVCFDPAKSHLKAAVDSGRIKVFEFSEIELREVAKQMDKHGIKIHDDDIPNAIGALELSAELVTDDYVLFEAVHKWRDIQNRSLFVLNTRGFLFELFLAGGLDFMEFVQGVLELFRTAELPNILHQVSGKIITISDAERLFGEYESYLLKALVLRGTPAGAK